MTPSFTLLVVATCWLGRATRLVGQDAVATVGQKDEVVQEGDWAKTLVCECKEVNSEDDCPNYKIKEGGFPPSFPRFYHHQVEKGLKLVNYCCSYTSSEITKGWFSRKKDTVDKELCMKEKRPIHGGKSCCTLRGEGDHQDKATSFFLKSGTSYRKAYGKPESDVMLQDYSKKSKLFFGLEDIRYGVSPDFQHVAAEKAREWVAWFNASYVQSAELHCTEEYKDVTGKRALDSTCRLGDREAAGACCCAPDNLALQVSKSCNPQKCAPSHQVFQSEFEEEEALIGEEIGAFVKVVDHEFYFPDPLARCPKVQNLPSGGALVRTEQIMRSSCAKTDTREIGWVGETPSRKTYCVVREYKMKCPGGQLEYDYVPGNRLLRDGEYACKAGMKNDIKGDPNYDHRCKCV